MEYYRHLTGGEPMDENSIHVEGPENMPEKKYLSATTKVIFFFAIPVLTFIYSLGVLKSFGFPVMLIAAAMNVLLALELEKSAPKLLLLLFVNLIPFAAMYVYTMSFAVALNTLFVLAFSLPTWLTLQMGCGRSVSIAASAALASLLFCATFALAVFLEKGALNITTVTEVIDAVLAPLKEAFSDIKYLENGVEKPLFASSDVSLMMYTVKSVTIGSVAFAMIVWAYLVTVAVRMLASAFGTAWRLPLGIRVTISGKMTEDGSKVNVTHEPVLWRIDIDSVSVGIYILTYLVVLFGGANVSMFYTVVMNIFIILSPGFIYCALRNIILGIRGKASRKITLLPIVIGAVLFFMNPSFIVFLLGAVGIAAVIRDNMARREGLKKRKE